MGGRSSRPRSKVAQIPSRKMGETGKTSIGPHARWRWKEATISFRRAIPYFSKSAPAHAIDKTRTWLNVLEGCQGGRGETEIQHWLFCCIAVEILPWKQEIALRVLPLKVQTWVLYNMLHPPPPSAHYLKLKSGKTDHMRLMLMLMRGSGLESALCGFCRFIGRRAPMPHQPRPFEVDHRRTWDLRRRTEIMLVKHSHTRIKPLAVGFGQRPRPLHSRYRYTRTGTCVRWGMAIAYSRYKFVTVSLPKRFRNGRFTSKK